MKKETIIEQRTLKSKTGKERKGMFKFIRETTIFSTGADEDPQAIEDAFNTAFSNRYSREETILNYIDEQEKLAKRVIREAGIEPDDNKTIFTFEDGNRGNSSWAIAEKKRKREPEGYAGDVLQHAKWLKGAIKRNDLFEALFNAIKMEEAYGNFNLSQYELSILIGDQVIAKGAKSAKFNKEQKEGWLLQAKEIRLEKPELKYSDIARRIVKSSKLNPKSYQTVYKYLLGNKEKM